MALPNIILAGYLAGSEDYLPLARSLSELGLKAIVVPLSWWEWLPTVGGRSIAPILQKLDTTIKKACEDYQVSQVNIIAHSAGGWLARIYLGQVPYYDRSWGAYPQVSNLITLGTPHRSQEPWTSRNLDFVNDNYPGAFHPKVRYVCVAGKSVYGEQKLGQFLAFNSYKLTCGIGNTWGDGITPIEAAHLEGAENLVVEGALHSAKAKLWYGSSEILPSWISYLR